MGLVLVNVMTHSRRLLRPVRIRGRWYRVTVTHRSGWSSRDHLVSQAFRAVDAALADWRDYDSCRDVEDRLHAARVGCGCDARLDCDFVRVRSPWDLDSTI